MSEWVIRAATPDDAPDVADVLITARRASTARMPPPAHTDAELRSWVAEVLLRDREVWVVDAGGLIGFLALDAAWLDHLYVRPEYAGQGVGGALLDLAKVLRPDGFGLWVFVTNLPARRFYERHGLVEIERTDGSANEEREPDIHYAWEPV